MESNTKKIFYWSPTLVNIATNTAVINSAYSMNRYDKKFDCYIINFFGEFERYNSIILNKKIKLINYFNWCACKDLNLKPPDPKSSNLKYFFLITLILATTGVTRQINSRYTTITQQSE